MKMLEFCKMLLFKCKYKSFFVFSVKLGDIVAQIKSEVAQILKYAADSNSKYVIQYFDHLY